MFSRSQRELRKRARWWLLAVVAALTAFAVLFIWVSEASHRQERVMQTALAVFVSFTLTLIWLLFFSRLRWKIRLISFAAIVLVLFGATKLFRFKGFSGDLVPSWEWRWKKSPSETVSPTPSVDSNEIGSTGESSLIEDYPQFLGPNRNAILGDIRLARDWSKRPPRLIWRQPIGAGWSGFAVFGESAVTQEQHGEQETVVCYELKTGKVKWRHEDRTKYETVPAGVGPRATPTIVKGRVYSLGGTGILNCLDLASGRQIWSKDIVTDKEVPNWGMSGSPLVFDDLVVVSAGRMNGGSLVAFNRHTGEDVWSAGDDPAGYSSPLLTMLAGVRQILIFNYGSVSAHQPFTGKILWRHAWPKSTECVAQPVPLPGNRVFVSSGYGIGCKLFQIHQDEKGNPDEVEGLSRLRASLIWETPRLKAKFTNVVFRDGYIYGLDDGVLVCLDVGNGQPTWKRGRYGHGQVILVGGLLLVQTESGDVVLVEANPNTHHELTRFSALNGKTWNSPALAGSYLLVRNDREAACYELPSD